MLRWILSIFAPITRRKSLGARGELLAARHLRSKGYQILMRNYHGANAEIDIVSRLGDMLVFVEVKTRRSGQINQPHRQVNRGKQHRLTRAARSYLSHYKNRQPPARFDVISIIWPEQGQPTIEHITNAFEPTY